ncbi:MAG: nuclear transport factor 2 family protein [Myxococcales bacterium]|nr:nuclear transport factor 2 family protein [Myxococcales bacterium]
MSPAGKLFVALVAASAIGCARAPPPKREPVEVRPPSPEEQLRKLARRAYAALAEGELESWAGHAAGDAHVFGLGPGDAYVRPESCVEEARRQLIPIGLVGDSLHAKGSEVKVGVAPGGQSAWLWDFPVMEQRGEGGVKGRWKVRLTAHAYLDGKSWRLDAVHASVGYPNEDLYRPSAGENLGAPAELSNDVPPDAEPLVEGVKRLVGDPKLKIERTSDRDEVVLIGTDAAEVFEGGKSFKEWARAQLPQLEKAVFSMKLAPGVRARVAPSGETGWVAGNVVLTLGTGKKALTLPPFRGLFIFLRDGEEWSLVSDHQSVGVPTDLRQPLAVEGPDAGEP